MGKLHTYVYMCVCVSPISCEFDHRYSQLSGGNVNWLLACSLKLVGNQSINYTNALKYASHIWRNFKIEEATLNLNTQKEMILLHFFVAPLLINLFSFFFGNRNDGSHNYCQESRAKSKWTNQLTNQPAECELENCKELWRLWCLFGKKIKKKTHLKLKINGRFRTLAVNAKSFNLERLQFTIQTSWLFVNGNNRRLWHRNQKHYIRVLSISYAEPPPLVPFPSALQPAITGITADGDDRPVGRLPT